MHESDLAVLEWIQKYSTSKKCEKIEDLYDGIILASILNEICPDHFDTDVLTPLETDNWALAASNLRQLLRMISSYFSSVHNTTIHYEDINLNLIAKEKNVDEIYGLLELVLGVGVMSENKESFVSNIFELSSESQLILKQIVENGLNRVKKDEEKEDIQVNSTDENKKNDDNLEQSAQNNSTNNDLIEHFNKERDSLLKKISSLENEKENLKINNNKLLMQIQTLETNNETLKLNSENIISNLKQENNNLSTELNDLKQNYENLIQSNSTNNQQNATNQLKIKNLTQQVKELEEKNLSLNDTIELLNEKNNKNIKNEILIEKLQKKIESLLVLKNDNKQLEQEIEKLKHLEIENETLKNSLQNNSKILETNKNSNNSNEIKLVELETQLSSQSNLIQQYENDIKQFKLLKQNYEKEIFDLKIRLETLSEVENDETTTTTSSNSSSSLVISLKDRIKELEASLDEQNRQNKTSSLLQSSEEYQKLKDETNNIIENLQKEIALLKSNNINLDSSSDSPVYSKEIQELKKALNLSESTAKSLSERLKEKILLNNKLEQEKSKLANFARYNISKFTEKFNATLLTFQEKIKNLEEQNRKLIIKAEKSESMHELKEKLISSAIYETGMKLMDQAFNQQLLLSVQPNQNSLLNLQREALSRSLPISSMNSSK